LPIADVSLVSPLSEADLPTEAFRVAQACNMSWRRRRRRLLTEKA
jgi:hypothetical protein